MVNYFELMNVPQQFQIDIAKLQQTLRQLQSKFHPDVRNSPYAPYLCMSILNVRQGREGGGVGGY